MAAGWAEGPPEIAQVEWVSGSGLSSTWVCHFGAYLPRLPACACPVTALHLPCFWAGGTGVSASAGSASLPPPVGQGQGKAPNSPTLERLKGPTATPDIIPRQLRTFLSHNTDSRKQSGSESPRPVYHECGHPRTSHTAHLASWSPQSAVQPACIQPTTYRRVQPSLPSPLPALSSTFLVFPPWSTTPHLHLSLPVPYYFPLPFLTKQT